MSPRLAVPKGGSHGSVKDGGCPVNSESERGAPTQAMPGSAAGARLRG